MAQRNVTITLRDKQTTGGLIPGDAVFGEPFVNLYDGILKFSGVTGGSFEPTTQSGVFEVGSTLYNQKITNRLNINNNFIISGDTGLISTYGGASGAGLSGKFLSGTTAGFVVANISDIQGVQTFVQNGTNIFTGGTPSFPTINLVASPSFNNITYSGTSTGGNSIATNVSATTNFYSAGTSLETIIYNIANSTENITSVQPGSNITTGGTASSPIISVVASPSFNNITYSGTSTGGAVNATSLSATNLTNTRVLIAGANGLITDDAGMTYNSSTNVLTVNGNLTTNDTQYSGGTIVDDGIFIIDAATNVQVDSTLLPTVHLIYNLGAIGQRWNNIYTKDLDVSGAISTTGITISGLLSGSVVYVGAGGELKTETGFAYNDTTDTFSAKYITVGVPGQTGTSVVINGDVQVLGASISAFTSQLYIEDNLIELNYNPTASTTSTSLGAGWLIQDGSGLAGTDVLWDIRGTSTGLQNRSFATNLEDIRIRETGTIASPNGVRVIAEYDILYGGSY